MSRTVTAGSLLEDVAYNLDQLSVEEGRDAVRQVVEQMQLDDAPKGRILRNIETIETPERLMEYVWNLILKHGDLGVVKVEAQYDDAEDRRELVEGGFFDRDVAEETAQEYRDETGGDYVVKRQQEAGSRNWGIYKVAVMNKLSSFDTRTATSEEYGPQSSWEARRQRSLQYYDRIIQKQTNPNAPEGTEVLKEYRDEPQNVEGHTRSMYSASRMAEQILRETEKGAYITVQEAFDGYTKYGWKWASENQKADLARILRSFGCAIVYEGPAKVDRVQVTATLDTVGKRIHELRRETNDETLKAELAECEAIYADLRLAEAQTDLLKDFTGQLGAELGVGTNFDLAYKQWPETGIVTAEIYQKGGDMNDPVASLRDVEGQIQMVTDEGEMLNPTPEQVIQQSTRLVATASYGKKDDDKKKRRKNKKEAQSSPKVGDEVSVEIHEYDLAEKQRCRIVTEPRLENEEYVATVEVLGSEEELIGKQFEASLDAEDPETGWHAF